MAVDKEIKKEAKKRYLKGEDPAVIATELEINYYTVIAWVTKGSKQEKPWAEERQELEGERVAEAILDHSTEMEEIISLGFGVLCRGMRYLHESCANVDLRDAERITKMIDTMKKWSEKDEKASMYEESGHSGELGQKNVINKPINHPFLKKAE